MATDHDSPFGEKRPGTSSLPSELDMRTQPHASGAAPSPEPASSGSAGTFFGASILALIFGCAGAWAYVEHVRPMLKGQDKSEPESKAQAAVDTAVKDVSALSTKLEGLSAKVNDLQTRTEKRPAAVSPEELVPIHEQLAALKGVTGKIDALEQQFAAFPAKIDENAKQLAVVASDLNDVHKQMASIKQDFQASQAQARAAESKPAREPKTEESLARTSHEEASAESTPKTASFEPGIGLFQKKEYGQASEYFQGLTEDQPEDARVWYYAALSRGLATNDWKGETEQLVRTGMEREKAGTPEKAKIDAAFAGLTTETGKDWLNFFRQRAR